jgi:hypothetical protein
MDDTTRTDPVRPELDDCCRHIAGAKKELVAFRQAVGDLYGKRLMGLATEYWLQGLERTPLSGGRIDIWRAVTIFAADMLAMHALDEATPWLRIGGANNAQ